MWARLRIATAVAVAMATGCSADHTTTPPDSPGGGGLSVTWTSKPAVIPSEPSSDITIERAEFLQDNLRVLGEAGTFDLVRDELEWARGIVPAPLPVDGALPGRYVRLLFDLEGDEEDKEYAYEITGTVKINDAFRPFTIRDTGDFPFAFDFSITLPAGGSATIPVRVEIDRIVNAVDFLSVTPQDGVYLVEDGHPQLPAVRAALTTAFGITGPT